MIFNSLIFIIMFPIVIILYYSIPEKVKNIFLFFTSLCFYACFKVSYVFLLLSVIGITYISALAMEGKKQTYKKRILAADVIAAVGLLFVFKYTNMFLESLRFVTNMVGIEFPENRVSFILPVGISFYTFVALGYLVDVYREKIEAEKDFIVLGTFVAFFPPLLSGPIERAGNLLKQIKGKKRFSEERIIKGVCRMLWGYFQKVVIADRIAVIVNAVYGNDENYTGIYVLLATWLYAFQIYCDFAGYSDLAIGASAILGFELKENFNVPYKAVDISDFWDRWHISLSTWLRDYVYISLGGNRKGKIKKYRNLLITFLVSGIWHGANWTFVIWGGLHGFYNILHNVITNKWKLGKGKIITGLRMICTFMMVDFAWLFFRADSLEHAFRLISKMIVNLDILSLLDREMAISMGVGILDIVVLAIALLVLIVIDFSKERINYCNIIVKAPLVVRWAIFYAVIFVILIFGFYGPGFETGQFIYAQF